ncbi:hypothetical protein T492DRAFT_255040 [Pavlovales sp. CCMP2436]|nr:hypothetical protein T492DRAFT_255040 [Pavlovales sp. CCMP2436]
MLAVLTCHIGVSHRGCEIEGVTAATDNSRAMLEVLTCSSAMSCSMVRSLLASFRFATSSCRSDSAARRSALATRAAASPPTLARTSPEPRLNPALESPRLPAAMAATAAAVASSACACWTASLPCSRRLSSCDTRALMASISASTLESARESPPPRRLPPAGARAPAFAARLRRSSASASSAVAGPR